MNQTSPLCKPVLNEESFRRLLTAAYILQQQHDGLLAKLTPAVSAGPLRPAPATWQPSALTFALQLRQALPPAPEGTAGGASSLPENLVPPFTAAIPSGNVVWSSTVSGPIFWRAVEWLAIAAVFGSLLVSVMIHCFVPLPGGSMLPSETDELRSSSQPTEGMATLPTPEETSMMRSRLRSNASGEGDFVARDTVVRYGKRSGNPDLEVKQTIRLPFAAGDPIQQTNLERLSFGRGSGMLAADTVVRYVPSVSAPRTP
jgi:hypothetical protein